MSNRDENRVRAPLSTKFACAETTSALVAMDKQNRTRWRGSDGRRLEQLNGRSVTLRDHVSCDWHRWTHSTAPTRTDRRRGVLHFSEVPRISWAAYFLERSAAS